MSSFRFAQTAALATGLLLFAACADSPTAGNGGVPRPGPVAEPATVASVRLSPDTLTLLAMGGYQAVGATALTRTGRVLENPTITWTTSDPAIATVDVSGNVVAYQPGRAWITATVDGITARARVDVAPLTVDTLVMGATSIRVQWGTARNLVATPYAADGRALQDRAITWTTSDSTVAAVSPGGRVTAMGGGSAWITATSEGHSARAEVVVPIVKVMTLADVGGTARPAFISDVIHDDGDGKRRRVRVEAVEGTLSFHSREGTYTQQVTLRTYTRLGTCTEWGSCIWNVDETVQTRVVSDHGTVERNVYTGEPIFVSAAVQGWRYYAQNAPADGFTVWQDLPGTGIIQSWSYRL